MEYNFSCVYHALYEYCDRDNIALKGLAKFFKESGVEDRDQTEKSLEYQNIRGGSVKIQPMVMPQSEFDHTEKGYALFDKLIPMSKIVENEFDVKTVELALSLEKIVNVHRTTSPSH